jgi:hypothetical protein
MRLTDNIGIKINDCFPLAVISNRTMLAKIILGFVVKLCLFD